MEEKSEFYTLTGYKLKNHYLLTEAMEDYLEMIYRNGTNITVKKLKTKILTTTAWPNLKQKYNLNKIYIYTNLLEIFKFLYQEE